MIRIVIHIKYRNTYRLGKKCIVTPLQTSYIPNNIQCIKINIFALDKDQSFLYTTFRPVSINTFAHIKWRHCLSRQNNSVIFFLNFPLYNPRTLKCQTSIYPGPFCILNWISIWTKDISCQFFKITFPFLFLENYIYFFLMQSM